MKEWKRALLNDDTANVVVAIAGSKRKAVRPLYTLSVLEAHRILACRLNR